MTNTYQAVIVDGWLRELAKVQDAGAHVATVMLIYSFIDALASFALPDGRDQVKSADFIAFVDKYLKADTTSEYQYCGNDLNNARNGLLHKLSPQAGRPNKNNPGTIGYCDNGPHRQDAATDPKFIILSVAVLVHDFSKALETFMTEVSKDPDLKRRLDSRIVNCFQTYTPVQEGK